MILGIEVVLGILVFLILAYIAFIVYVNWPNDTPLVKDIRVTQEWTEVDISPALRPTKRVQEINLRIHNFKTDLRPHSFKITLRNGTVIEPEIELYDEYGGKFEMHHSGFVRKNYDDIVFSQGVQPIISRRAAVVDSWSPMMAISCILRRKRSRNCSRIEHIQN